MTRKKRGGTLPKNEKSFALKTVIQKIDLKKRGLKHQDMNEKTIKAATNMGRFPKHRQAAAQLY